MPRRIFILTMTLALTLKISTTWLSIPTPHAHISTNPYPASLLGHGPTERCAFLQPREFLGAEDGKVNRLHLHPEVK
jgi:hypothetical protein